MTNDFVDTSRAAQTNDISTEKTATKTALESNLSSAEEAQHDAESTALEFNPSSTGHDSDPSLDSSDSSEDYDHGGYDDEF